MITLIRSVSAMPGKTAAARALAAEINGYVREVHGLDVELVLPVGGNPQRHAWFGRYKDMAALEAAMRKLSADKRFAELNAKTAELYMPGSMHDEIWASA